MERMIELSDAAQTAHELIYGAILRRSDDSVDVVATVLSWHIAIFAVRSPGAQAVCLTDEDLANGAFHQAATRFEYFDQSTAFTGLTVRHADLIGVVEKLRPAV